VKTVLVTGSTGFVGRNLKEALQRQPEIRILTLDRQSSDAQWSAALDEADLIYHLAGTNRPKSEDEFLQGNAGVTRELCAKLTACGRRPKIVFASSIQAACDNAYGASKRAAEAALEQFAAATGAEAAIYRLPNLFGKWCRPNYNSVVATFCHNIARDLPIQISDPTRELELLYIDDVVAAFIHELTTGRPGVTYPQITGSHRVSLGALATMIQSFRDSRRTLMMPDLSGGFAKKLYAAYVSYLPEDGFAYPLEQRTDNRGCLAEFLKSSPFGQVFVSRTKPGVTRGDHYHHTKAERFLVLEGDAVIRFRHIERDAVIEYPISGRDLKVVDIPPGYTHSIENVGAGEMVVLFWASEVFDPQRPDTYFLPVQRTAA
jgi:UDP-2-acetamido-2,6-beta-L-arabino-hexul-4-ose reductase